VLVYSVEFKFHAEITDAHSCIFLDTLLTAWVIRNEQEMKPVVLEGKSTHLLRMFHLYGKATKNFIK
jgi:hypothetical protein